MWYNINDLLSYNCVYNFIVGMRGGGKSFAFKEKVIKNFLKDGSQFIYLRRYKTELYKISTFFEPDIQAKFPNVEFKVQGNRFYINGEIAGYAIALTRSMIEKSNNYANVTLIGFDEFILDPQSTYKYLKNEFDVFNNFYDTVDRNKDKTRVLFIGNAISEVNPYFQGLAVQIDHTKRFTKIVRGGEVLAVIEVWSDTAIQNKRKSTRFGKLLAGTDYDEFSNNNKFYRDNVSFIREKPTNAIYLFSIFTEGSLLGVWQDRQYLDMYVTSEYRKRSLFCVKPSETQDKQNYGCPIKLLDFKSSSYGRRLVRASQHQYLFFDSQEIKDKFISFSRHLPY